jgi:hypothetical protein
MIDILKDFQCGMVFFILVMNNSRPAYNFIVNFHPQGKNVRLKIAILPRQ